MNTLHHLLFATALANAGSRSRRERRWIMGAAILPDVDGAPFWSRELWESVHHTVGHNLFFAGAVAAAGLAIASDGRRLRLAALAGASVIGLHYAIDLAISATWPFRPFWPFSDLDVNPGNFVADTAALDRWLRVPVQWALIAVAVALTVATYRRHGHTFLELVSWKLDDLVAGYVARIVKGSRCLECGKRAGFRCASCHSELCGSHVTIRRLEACCSDCRVTGSEVAPS